MRSRSLALLYFLPLFSVYADVPDWISGRASLDDYESISGRGTLQSGFTLFGTARPKFSEKLDSKLMLRGSAYRKSLDKPDDFSIRGEVKEAWVEYPIFGIRVRAGQIITPWGRSDAVNPTDYLTAKDYTTLSIHDDIRRIGAPGILSTFTPNEGTSPLEFSFAWNARYAQSKMLIPASQIPTGISVETDPRTPLLFTDNEEFALKVSYLASGWDASLSAFDGRNHFGQFVWDGSRVGLQFYRTRAIGGDFSVTFDDFVLRGESAYFFYETGSSGLGGLSLTEPNHWDSVLGIERGIGARFRIIAQALFRFHPDLKDSQAYVGSSVAETAIVRGLGRANAIIQNYQNRSRLGATLLGSYESEDEKWRAEFSMIGNFVGGDYVLRPKLEHKIMDSVRLTAGLDYYGGPEDQPLGALSAYRSVYLEGAMTF